MPEDTRCQLWLSHLRLGSYSERRHLSAKLFFTAEWLLIQWDGSSLTIEPTVRFHTLSLAAKTTSECVEWSQQP